MRESSEEARVHERSKAVVRACALVRAGGIVLFPTETFYAIGTRVHASAALHAICRIKDRPPEKPLPLAAASLAQVANVCRTELFPPELFALWPGPLTLLLPLRSPKAMDAAVRNGRGEVALRVSSHPLVRTLARASGECLTVSSANCAGKSPVCAAESLDPVLLARLDREGLPWMVLEGETLSKALLPSTIVRPHVLPCGRKNVVALEMLRVGAVSRSRLLAAGFCCFEPRSVAMQKRCTCPHCGKEYSVYCNPLPAADVLIYEPSQGIVVIKRANTPVGYAIPGGFIEEGECAEAAAVREMREETGLDVVLDGLLGVYSHPERDPRCHTMTVVYVGHPKDWTKLAAGDDAAQAAFYPLDKLPHPLVFDHEQVVRDFLDYVKGERALAPLDTQCREDA